MTKRAFRSELLLARRSQSDRQQHRRSLRQHNRELERLATRRQAALRFFSSAVEQSAASIIITDLQGNIKFVNPAFTTITGYTHEEVLGQNPRLLKSGEHPPEFYSTLWATLARGEVWKGEFMNRRKDGALFHERAIISPIRDENGRITHYVAVKEDITAHKAAEDALRKGEALFGLAFENANVGMCMVALDGRFTRVNRQLCRIFGASATTLLQLRIHDLVHPAYRDVSPLFVQHLRADRAQQTTFEQQYCREDGSCIWGLTSSTLVRDTQGAPLYYVAYIQDVTDRKQAELALRESEERFAAVLNSLQAAIYVANMETHELLFVNHHICRTFGVIEGQRCWEVLQGEQQKEPCNFCTDPQLFTPTGETAGPQMREYRSPRNGRWYHLHNEAIQWIDGRWVRLEVATDITALKDAEQRLLEQQRQLVTLEERERIGRDLHDDLGQVLSYINVQTQAIQDLLTQDKTPQAQRLLTQLTQAAQNAHSDLRHYILGIRTDTVIPSQKSSTTFLEALQQHLDELAQLHAFMVQLQLPEEALEQALMPEVELQLLRIIQEALTNARKHAGVAEAHLRFSLDEREVQAIIEDQGRGFNARSHATPLTDLIADDAPHFGLEIMRERAAKVGGSVRVESAPGKGVRVTVRMPRARAIMSQVDGVESNLGPRVVLADDHPLFLEGLRTLLASRGVQVVGVARNGEEAQAQVRELRPDIVAIDINMPVCDGLEATRRIKAEFPDTKIVILTVSTEDADLYQALKNGASGYLLKSLNADELLTMLADVMRGEVVFSPGIAARVLQEFSEHQAATPSPDASAAPSDVAMDDPDAAPEPVYTLTPRQLQILRLVAQGMTYKEIALKLFITERTIKYHMGEILERLQLASRKEAIAYMRRAGLPF